MSLTLNKYHKSSLATSVFSHLNKAGINYAVIKRYIVMDLLQVYGHEYSVIINKCDLPFIPNHNFSAPYKDCLVLEKHLTGNDLDDFIDMQSKGFFRMVLNCDDGIVWELQNKSFKSDYLIQKSLFDQQQAQLAAETMQKIRDDKAKQALKQNNAIFQRVIDKMLKKSLTSDEALQKIFGDKYDKKRMTFYNSLDESQQQLLDVVKDQVKEIQNSKFQINV